MASRGAQHPRRWTPKQLGTLDLWLDADDATTITIATGISQWDDKSGNGRHATQSTGSKQPTLVRNDLNGRTAVRFTSSSSQVLNTTHSFQGYGSFAVYAVMRTVSSASRSLVRMQPSTPGESGYFAFPYDQNVAVSWDGGLLAGATGTQSSSLVLGFLRVKSGTRKVRRDGSENASATANANTAAFTGGGNLFTAIGGFWNGEYYNGWAHEIVIHGAELVADDRDRLEGYLAHKWGLAGSLPSGHAYKSVAP